jgi:TolB-like protein/Tfp pilus assembly protein PilF
MGDRLSFGPFALDTRTGELREDERPVPLQDKPLRLLEILLERGGDLVTRDELVADLWPDAHVDFDNSLNNAMSRLRTALHDDPARPRYVETIGRRGYRFLAQVRVERSDAPRSLVVLPLAAVAPDVDELLADGLTEALIAELTRLSGLRVVSATTAFRYKRSGKSLPTVARELRVDMAVEGSVARQGGRVRVAVRLLDAAADAALWATTCERDLVDVFSLQADMASAIAEEMHVGLGERERTRLGQALKVDPDVHEAYLKGRHHWNKRTEGGLRRAITFFQAAIDRDPAYAPAYVGLADCYNSLATVPLGAPPREVRPMAIAAAERALELDAGLGEAHASLAYARLYDAEWQLAEEGFRRALDLRPGYAEAHAWSAHFHAARGRPSEALAAARRARQLDPLSLYVRMTNGFVLHLDERYDEARQEYESALELEESGLLLGFLALNHLSAGEPAEASRTLERAMALEGRRAVLLAYTAAARADLGDHAQAGALRQEIVAEDAKGYVPPFALAFASFATGDDASAYRCLEAACAEHANASIYFGVIPCFRKYRSDPRFQAIMSRLGL